MKISAAKYGGLRGTPLAPEDLEGDAAVFTIQEFGEQANSSDKRRQLSPVLRYAECPDKLHYLNREQIERIIPKLGDESDNWIGKQVPVAVEDVEGPAQSGNGTQVYKKVYVMKPEKWDAAFRAAKRQTGTSSRSRSRGK